MFKKSLAAVAVLGAFAASSFAADVTFYGKVDAGFKYENTTITDFHDQENVDEALTLDSGVQDASRFGIKAKEDLGNGYQVGFVLENGFKNDDGSSLKNNRLFDRQAHLDLTTPYGTFIAGRTGAVTQASGPFDIVMSRADSFDGGHKDVLGFVQAPKVDNLLGYVSPKFAGFQAAAAYSFKNDKDEADTHAEGHDSANRYAAFALTYDIGALQTAISYEQILRSTVDTNKQDAKIVTFGGNYDFDMFKLFAMGQYFDGVAVGDAMDSTGLSIKDALITDKRGLSEDGVEGYGVHFGATFDALGGAWETAVYYVKAEVDLIGTGTNNPHRNHNYSDVDGEYFGVAARYAYALSSRTFVKASVGYDQATWDQFRFGPKAQATDWEKDRYFGRVSLVHNF